jgi:hypothetical protein
VSTDVPARAPRTTTTVLAAAVVSGVSGYLVLVLAARVLDAAAAARFLVFWGALFSLFGVLIGVTTETTRTVFSGRDRVDASTRVLPVALGLGAVVLVAVAGSGPVWAPRLFGEGWAGLLVALLLGVAAFVVHATMGGAAAGRADWPAYSLLVGLEAAVRLVLCTVAAVLGADVLGFAWAAAAGCGTWIALTLASARYRALWSVRADVDPLGLLRRMVLSCAASGVSALLLVGYPVLLRITTPDAVFAGAAPIVLAVSLCRAPLLVPLGAYQNVVVTRVLTHGVGALVPVVAVLGGLTAVGAVAAWPVGPRVMHLVNPGYDVDGAVFAALVVAAGLVALLTLTGAAAVGLGHHTVYLVGWIVATLTALATLLVPGSLETRVVTSLLVAPVLGVAVHLVWGARTSARVSDAQT